MPQQQTLLPPAPPPPPPPALPDPPLKTPNFGPLRQLLISGARLDTAINRPAPAGTPIFPSTLQLDEMMRFSQRSLVLLEELNNSLNAMDKLKDGYNKFKQENSRMNFNSAAAKKKRKGYDLAHRASFDVLRKLVALRELKPSGLQSDFNIHLRKLCDVMGVPAAAAQDFFSKLQPSRQEVRNFISAMNSALDNLTPGHASINRATGARFDPAFKRRSEVVDRGRTLNADDRQRNTSVEFTPNSREIARSLMALGALPSPRYTERNGRRYVESSHVHTTTVPDEDTYRRLLWDLRS